MMRTDDAPVNLTCTDLELLLAALTCYEQKFKDERPEHLAEKIKVLRQKLLDIP